MALRIERAKVVLFVRVVGMAKVVEYGDGLDDTVDGLLAKRSDAGCHDRYPGGQVLSQLVVERANAYGLRVHEVLHLWRGRRKGRRASSCAPSRGAGVSSADSAFGSWVAA